MCGRFTSRFTWRELVELYRITEPYITPISDLWPPFPFVLGAVRQTERAIRRMLDLRRLGGLLGCGEAKIKSNNARILAK
jgi:hypothetical protein